MIQKEGKGFLLGTGRFVNWLNDHLCHYSHIPSIRKTEFVPILARYSTAVSGNPAVGIRWDLVNKIIMVGLWLRNQRFYRRDHHAYSYLMTPLMVLVVTLLLIAS
jgi:hypothetical protein